MTHTQPTRRRLFTRLPDEDLPPLQITDRDLGILQLVYDYRFIDTQQICALIRGSTRNLSERLSRLYHHGYVDRPRQQMAIRFTGYRHLVYALSRKGGRLLAAATHDAQYTRPRFTQNNRQIKAPQLLHTLMISKFRACLTLACQREDNLQLSHWEEFSRALTHVQTAGKRRAVVPDAMFLLQRTLANGQTGVARFFLEADRGTATYSRFADKLHAYWGMRAQETKLFGSPKRGYRVLTVTTSADRRDGLLGLCCRLDPARKGLRMFYFATAGAYAVDNPHRILARIWSCPRTARPQSILGDPSEDGGSRGRG